MKPFALTENRSLMSDGEQPPRSQNDAEAGEEESPDPEAIYPRDLDKRGLLVSLGVSVIVVALLIFGFL